MNALIAATAVWSAVSGVMLLRRNAAVFVTCALIAVASAVLQSRLATNVRESGGNRRFELPTLRVALPFFAAYLALASLWPLDGADLLWRAGLQFFPAGTMPIDLDVYLALEHIAAFTLVGYVIAEVHGRADRAYREMVLLVVAWGTGLALLLEVTRGLHPQYGASGLLFLLSAVATVFGGWMYHLQRDHVRALAAQRSSPSQPASTVASD
jgi:hypothetical protein